ncbi:uncharacterized protein LOC121265716 [Juglans microcarpa x Juglans regia]|uniref:uncharacterized protein LOC121265716 n=1 Tax=Juglans microcarpa x Juglans regia TaxID=2249226 RepID=UPI001B7E7120|nr:uncharacterized protein LOC121265716 [Juglans microcarpa x Juglans regia]
MVKSAYKLLSSLQRDTRSCEPSTAQEQKKMLSGLWKLQILNKVKIFAWRACQNGLPIKSNLKKRQVALEDNCVFCGTEEEDIIHAIYQCRTIRQCWIDLGLGLQLEARYIDFVEFVTIAQKNGSKEEVEKFLVIAWGFWYRSNKKMFDDSEVHPIAAVHQTLALWSDLKQLKGIGKKSNGRWIAPLVGSL